VQPETATPDQDRPVPPLIVRTLGGSALPLGARVTLHARGPVLAWPDPDPAG
jgi:hypothetical protein